MFALYAALSSAVPSRLCSSAVLNNAVRSSSMHAAGHPHVPGIGQSGHHGRIWLLAQGVSQGFANCVYNHDGDYSQNQPVKLFWLVFWALQQLWISGFSAFMGYAMFPQCFRRVDLCVIIFLAAASALVTVVGAPVGHVPLNASLLVYLPSKEVLSQTLQVFPCASNTLEQVAILLCMWHSHSDSWCHHHISVCLCAVHR